jgi:hypothetical protein
MDDEGLLIWPDRSSVVRSATTDETGVTDSNPWFLGFECPICEQWWPWMPDPTNGAAEDNAGKKDKRLRFPCKRCGQTSEYSLLAIVKRRAPPSAME